MFFFLSFYFLFLFIIYIFFAGGHLKLCVETKTTTNPQIKIHNIPLNLAHLTFYHHHNPLMMCFRYVFFSIIISISFLFSYLSIFFYIFKCIILIRFVFHNTHHFTPYTYNFELKKNTLITNTMHLNRMDQTL